METVSVYCEVQTELLSAFWIKFRSQRGVSNTKTRVPSRREAVHGSDTSRSKAKH
jgi:hypothetical protein